MDRLSSRAGWLLATAVLAGCAAVPPPRAAPEIGSSPWALQSTASAGQLPIEHSRWRQLDFPGKSPTRFRYVHQDGRHAVSVLAASSAGMLRKKVRIEPAQLGTLRFSWRVPQLIAGADIAVRESDDSPVRIVLAFEGDRSRFSVRDAMLSELVHALSGEEMPYATLMYVWSNRRSPGTLIASPRTDRIRTLVVESGSNHLDQWLDYERDVRADYVRAFGEPPGALVGIGLMTDSDNTRTTARAWYGTVRLGSSPPAASAPGM